MIVSVKSYGRKRFIMVSAEELLRLGIQHSNIMERVTKGTLSAADVRREYQRLHEGKLLVENPFDYLKPYLLTLEEQLDYICHYNGRIWNGYFAKKTLDEAKRLTRSDHEQSVTDLEVLHVEGVQPGQTMDMLWAVIDATHPNSWRADHLQMDKIYLYEPQQEDDARSSKIVPVTNRYSSGIHVVRLNLLANWFPNDLDKMSVEQVRHNARTQGRVLAHGEVLSALAWMSGLVRQMDGDKFPWMDLAGYSWKDGSKSEAFGIWWNGLERSVDTGSYGVDTGMDGAAPEVLESRS